MSLEGSKNHFVAVIGGSIAGSEAAFQLAERGFQVVVFDQNPLPYGKIEDGLPLWHIKLRDKEEQIIDSKLDHKNIRFVPNVKLGKDIDFEDITRNWGFSAVLLAIGASKDRPLPITGIDNHIGKGFVYQNSFMDWFNHKHQSDYCGPLYDVGDEAIVVGGGLASLDVVKAVMIETVRFALGKKGIDENVFTLERSIRKVLDGHNLTLKDLGLKGCSLFYRRGAGDMPFSNLIRKSPKEMAKAQAVSKKILKLAQEKYLFHFREYLSPIDKIVDKRGRIEGLKFQKNQIVDGKAIPISGKVEEYRGSIVISSIGSLPEQVAGIPSAGTTFKMADSVHCQIEGYDNVFAVGNAVTGRGNIKESLHHGHVTTIKIVDKYLGSVETDYHNYIRATEFNVGTQAESIADLILKKNKMKFEDFGSLERKTYDLQGKVGYEGKYQKWIGGQKPVRLEEILGIKNL